jgi:acyl-CoA thioester hydrolase
MNRHPGSIHRHAVRVYYEDTDAGGVVYHSNYLRYAERARTEALRQAGIPHSELVSKYGLMFVVRRVEMDYVRPAMLDDQLVIETETVDLGAAWMSLRQVVHSPNGVCVDLRIKLACVRITGLKPARIPAPWREGLAFLDDRSLGGGSGS